MRRYIYTLYILLNLCLCTFATDKVDAVFTPEKGLYLSTGIYNANYAVGNVALDALNDTNWQLDGFKVSATNGVRVLSTGAYDVNSHLTATSAYVSLPEAKDGERIILIVESSLHSESYFDNASVGIVAQDGEYVEKRSISGVTDGTERMLIELTRYAGTDIKIKLGFESDSTNNGSGWSISAVKVCKAHKVRSMLKTGSATDKYNIKILNVNTENYPDAIYVEFTVMNDSGRFVEDLTLSDFNLKDNSRTKYGCNRLVQNLAEVTFPIDVVFLVDNSGSMSDEQENIRKNIPELISGLKDFGDVRVGLLRFGDNNQMYRCPDYAFEEKGNNQFFFSLSDDKEKDFFLNTIWKRNEVSGGYEPYYEVLNWAADQEFGYRQNAMKSYIMLGDEKVNDNTNNKRCDKSLSTLTDSSVATKLSDYGIQTFIIQNIYYFNEYFRIVNQTGGSCLNVTSPNYNELLSDISNKIKGRYVMRYCLDSADVAEFCSDESRTVSVEYVKGGVTASSRYRVAESARIVRSEETRTLDNRSIEPGFDVPIVMDIVSNGNVVDSVMLFYKNNGDTEYQKQIKVVEKQDTATAVSVEFTIPKEYIKNEVVQYYAEAYTHRTYGSGVTYKTKVSSPPYYKDDFYWSIAVTPNEAPLISKVSSTPATPCRPLTLYADVFDSTDSIASVLLRYRIRNTPSEYQTVEMRKLPSTSGTKYVGTINKGAFVDKSVEYYIIAADNYGMTGRYGTSETPLTITPDQMASNSLVGPMKIVVNSLSEVTLGCDPMTEADTIAAFYYARCDSADMSILAAKGTWSKEREVLELTVYGRSTDAYKDGYDEGEVVDLRLIKGGNDYKLVSDTIRYSSKAGSVVLGRNIIGVREPRLSFETADGLPMDTLDFGKAEAEMTRDVVIRNTGCDDLLLFKSEFDGVQITQVDAVDSIVVKPDSCYKIPFKYVPWDKETATLTVHTNTEEHTNKLVIKGDMARVSTCSGLKLNTIKADEGWTLNLTSDAEPSDDMSILLKSSCEGGNKVVWSLPNPGRKVGKNNTCTVKKSGLYRLSVYKGDGLCDFIIDLK